jgi:hypothetical protein
VRDFTDMNEVGTSERRGRPTVANEDAERVLSDLAGEDVHLGPKAVVYGAPEACPACGSRELMWGCAPDQMRTREEIHPLVWHETQWMADSFICRACWAGWIEPDDPGTVTWVRPYWRT